MEVAVRIWSTLEEIVLGQLDELNRLCARDGREPSEEIFQGGIAFNVVD
jgi:hypothetical protein